MKKNVLITGSTGFVGKYLCDYLENQYNVMGISRSSERSVDISQYKMLDNLEFVPEIIVHTAASISDKIEEAYPVNVQGTYNICKFAKNKNVQHLIVISSTSVFKESSLFSTYGLTKKQAEETAWAYCKEYNIPLTILRFPQVYDFVGKAEANQRMLYGFIKNITKSQQLSITGSEDPLRNYIDIDYVLSNILHTIRNRIVGRFNIVNPNSITISELARCIFRVLDIEPQIQFNNEGNSIPSIYIPKADILNSDTLPLPIEDGIRRIVNEYEKV